MAVSFVAASQNQVDENFNLTTISVALSVQAGDIILVGGYYAGGGTASVTDIGAESQSNSYSLVLNGAAFNTGIWKAVAKFTDTIVITLSHTVSTVNLALIAAHYRGASQKIGVTGTSSVNPGSCCPSIVLNPTVEGSLLVAFSASTQAGVCTPGFLQTQRISTRTDKNGVIELDDKKVFVDISAILLSESWTTTNGWRNILVAELTPAEVVEGRLSTWSTEAIVNSGVGGSQSKKLKIDIDGTTYYIPIYTA